MPKFSKSLILLAAALAVAAALGTAQPAQARSMSSCSAALIHDWYVDGRVDKTYPVHCYREALKNIPEDQAIYGTLRQDLTRALQSTIRQHGGHVTGDTLVVPIGGGGGGPNGTGSGGRGGVFHWLAQKLGPSTGGSIPISLLILRRLPFGVVAAARVRVDVPPPAAPWAGPGAA